MKDDQENTTSLPPPLQEIVLRPVRPVASAAGRSLVQDGQVSDTDGEIIPYEEAGTKTGSSPPLLFLLSFVLPMLAGFIYLFFVASDQYVSEARFIVRSVTTGTGDTAAALLASQGLARAGDEAYIVGDYVTSRDLLAKLVQQNDLKTIIARNEADIFNRYPRFWERDNNEELFAYFKRMVSAEVDPVTGISTVKVTAFRREDAQAIAQALLTNAEGLVNVLNRRAQENELSYADSMVLQAGSKLQAAETRLADYRNSNGIVDPETETSAAMKTITSLSTELSKAQINLSLQLALTPNSPAVSKLRESIRALTGEIDNQKQLMAGGTTSIAAKMAKFEQFTLERDIAARALASAEANRDRARQDAQKQHLYLQRIVEPNAPDQAAFPQRFLLLGACFLVFGAIFVSLRSLRKMIEEHAV